ncbi:MAG: TolC family protein, partial [Phaeodactylibacter sp.]|nr:TolC family protein [Phaeodactylibacter sp.]
VIGFPIDEPLLLSDNINSLSAEVSEDALTNPVNYQAYPQYQVAQLGLHLNELNIRLNKAGYLPSLAGFGSFQYSLLADKLSEGEWYPSTVVGLQLNIPIFDGLNKKAKVQRAKLATEVARNQILQLESAINLELSNARINYVNARRRLDNQEQNLQLAEKIYNTTQVKYKEGVGSSLEITQAEQSLYQSQQNYNQALYDLLVAKIGLEKALGQ